MRIQIRLLPTLALLASIAVGCSQNDALTGPDPLDPQFSISDGGHGDLRNGHFFFLPPMVPNPTTSGTFDGTFEPVVEICALVENEEVCANVPLTASFSRMTGTGSEVIRVVAAEEHYIVNWHTDLSSLDATKTYRIVVKVGTQVLGHADVDVVNSGKDLKNVDTGEFIPLKDGRTLPIKFRIEEGAITRIAFAQGGSLGIWTMNPDGSDQVQLTTGIDFWPNWSPDGTRIAFNSRIAGDAQIVVMNADGTGQTQLTFGTAGDNVPDWSPDGTQIAFQRGDFLPAGDADIWVMDANGSNQTNLTMSTSSDVGAKWSPDGTQIAFSRSTGGARQIWVMNANGTGQINLSSNGFSEIRPAWSPDGSQIAFGRGGRIFVMNADGSGGVTPLTVDFGDGNATPTWSPDGDKIAFDTGRDGSPDAREIYVMNADGSAQTRVTFRAGDDFFPHWGFIR